ncbi:hypothetical protein C0583_06420 [Candidatus Parcubacteria bacterium]|nr:MAG: hypothetical protein C0583_06420 [Candidatus Parcubacteria bacterium]
MVVISFVAVFTAGLSNSALGIWKAYFFESALVYIMFFNILFAEKDKIFKNKNLDHWYLKIVLAFSVSAFFVSLFAIYQKLTVNFISNEVWALAETRRVTSFFAYPNALGLFLAPIIMLQLGALMFQRHKSKENCDRVDCAKWNPWSLEWFKRMSGTEKTYFSFVKLTAVLSLVSIYFARSEGALIAVMAGMFLALLLFESFKSWGNFRLVGIGIALLLLILLFSSPFRDFTMTRISLNDFSGQIRKAQWEETAVYLRDGNWLWGAGLSEYQEKIAPYHKEGIYIKNDDPDFEHLIQVDPEYQKKHWQALEIFLYPHNVFLNFWVELGVFGMILFIWIIFRAIYISFSLLNRVEDLANRFLIIGALGAILTVIIHGIVDVPFFKNDLAVLFWMMVATLGALDLKLKNKNK